MKSHFYDLLHKMEIEPIAELNRLDTLFTSEKSVVVEGFPRDYYYTLEQFIDNTIFRSLPFRGTYTNIREMRVALNIASYQFDDSIECLFLYCEFLKAILPFVNHKNASAMNQIIIIFNNIDVVLEKTNYEWLERSSREFIIVEKNKITTEAVEIIKDDATAIKAIEYNHYALKGDLGKKKEILLKLADYVEPLLKSRKLEQNGFSDLQSDLGFVLNNFNIRHNNIDGNNAKEYVVKLTKTSELEKWYDNAYEMILMATITADHIDITNELKRIKSSFRW